VLLAPTRDRTKYSRRVAVEPVYKNMWPLPPVNLPWLRFTNLSAIKHLCYGIVLGYSLSVMSTWLVLRVQSRRRVRPAEQFTERPIELRSDEVLHGVTGLVGTERVNCLCINTSLRSIPSGNTPLIRINSLSNALGVEVLGKAEVPLIFQTKACA
jgi:cysteine synthase